MKERIIKYLRNLAIEAVTVYSFLIHKEAKPSVYVYLPLFLIMIYLMLKDCFMYVWNKVMVSDDV